MKRGFASKSYRAAWVASELHASAHIAPTTAVEHIQRQYKNPPAKLATGGSEILMPPDVSWVIPEDLIEKCAGRWQA